MKKTLYFIITVLLLQTAVNAQKHGDEYTGTLPIYLVFSTTTGKPIKAYQEPIDYIHFIGVNKPYREQDINLHYMRIKDTTQWEPNSKMLQDNAYNPEALSDKFLSIDTIYVVMQQHFNLADRAYTFSRLEDCIKYADKFKLEYIKIPYYYRDKRSYDEVYRIKKKRLESR